MLKYITRTDEGRVDFQLEICDELLEPRYTRIDFFIFYLIHTSSYVMLNIYLFYLHFQCQQN